VSTWRIGFTVLVAFCVIGTIGATARPARAANPQIRVRGATAPVAHWCNTNGITCTEPLQNWEDFSWFNRAEKSHVRIGEYIGHDEPLMEFYSDQPGAGNDNVWELVLPRDPPVRPEEDGSGGTWNFQLHPTFWIGMDICDDQSAPNPHYPGAPYPTQRCIPNSDENIYTSDDPSSPRYIGKAPGGAFLELQFYPPGWVKWPAGISCAAKRWCAALNIDSFSENENTGVANNEDCLNSAGIEPVNFAFVTKTGRATTSADPLNGARFNLAPGKDFFMESGDRLRVHIYDTPAGFVTVIDDLTQHTTGKMVASEANGFASVKFDPNADHCTLIRHGFHPEFSTSTPDTRLMWTAHTDNISLSDETGHWESCTKVDLSSPILACADNPSEEIDEQDDNYCLPIPGIPSSFIQITGCLAFFGDNDLDFDGIPYKAGNWPGSVADPTIAARLTPTPLTFTSPTTNGSQFTQAAFEADLPRIEDFRPDEPFGGIEFNCQRFIVNPSDPNPGAHCVKPPGLSEDYPFFVTATEDGSCVWKEVGGLHNVSGLLQGFGGIDEYGPLLNTHYPTDPAGSVTQRYNNFHRTLAGNPCPA